MSIERVENPTKAQCKFVQELVANPEITDILALEVKSMDSAQLGAIAEELVQKGGQDDNIKALRELKDAVRNGESLTELVAKYGADEAFLHRVEQQQLSKDPEKMDRALANLEKIAEETTGLHSQRIQGEREGGEDRSQVNTR